MIGWRTDVMDVRPEDTWDLWHNRDGTPYAALLFDSADRLVAWSESAAALLSPRPLKLVRGLPRAALLDGLSPGHEGGAASEWTAPDGRRLHLQVLTSQDGGTFWLWHVQAPARPPAAGAPDSVLGPLIRSVAFARHPLPLLVVDPASQCILAGNEAAAAFYGESREALQRRPLGELHGAYAGLLARWSDRPRQEGARLHHRRRDGSLIEARVHVETLELAGHRFLLLALTPDRIVPPEERRLPDLDGIGLREISEAIPMAMFVVRQHDGGILHANRLASRMLGAPTDELRGHRIQDFCARSEDPQSLLDPVRTAGKAADWELEIRRRDGARGWLSGAVRTVTYHGEPALLMLAADVTEHKRLAQDRLDAQREAERARRARDRLFAIANQDLRQPLAAL